MAQKQQFFNRELSWMAFNERVLEQAEDTSLPLLERMKFLAITASNLDEFYMVRVGSLFTAVQNGDTQPDPSGLSPQAQLQKLTERITLFSERQQKCYAELQGLLSENRIKLVKPNDLSDESLNYLERYCESELYPILTPMEDRGSFAEPLLQNLELHLLVRLSDDDNPRKGKYFLFPLGKNVRRFITIPNSEGQAILVPVEEAIAKMIHLWFPKDRVRECTPLRMTRNADIAVDEDDSSTLLSGMEEVLEARKTSSVIRLECSNTITATSLNYIRKLTGVRLEHIYPYECPLNLKQFMSLAFTEGHDELKISAMPPLPAAELEKNTPMFDQIRKRDLLFYHPYESFEPVVRLLQEAAEDSAVLAVKQVLYRTSSDSAIVRALKRAAENGKTVTALVELKARFDEANNINWARDLERSGVQVIYGIRGYKTHTKILSVVRRERYGIVRYCHFGTGNFNESTAKLYGDISYLTCREDLGHDAGAFFNTICGLTQPFHYKKISMAPFTLRSTILDEIDACIELAETGKKSAIHLKMNALVDGEIIKRLYKASNTGIPVKLNVRGICCLVPGVKGMSENIEVTSIIDRYLEHARIYSFAHGSKEKLYISSADLMPRNLDKRLELLIPIEDSATAKKMSGFLKMHFKDNQSAWKLNSDGIYDKLTKSDFGKNTRAFRSQEEVYKYVQKSIEEAREEAPVSLEPHKPN